MHYVGSRFQNISKTLTAQMHRRCTLQGWRDIFVLQGQELSLVRQLSGTTAPREIAAGCKRQAASSSRLQDVVQQPGISSSFRQNCPARQTL